MNKCAIYLLELSAGWWISYISGLVHVCKIYLLWKIYLVGRCLVDISAVENISAPIYATSWPVIWIDCDYLLWKKVVCKISVKRLTGPSWYIVELVVIMLHHVPPKCAYSWPVDDVLYWLDQEGLEDGEYICHPICVLIGPGRMERLVNISWPELNLLLVYWLDQDRLEIFCT